VALESSSRPLTALVIRNAVVLADHIAARRQRAAAQVYRSILQMAPVSQALAAREILRPWGADSGDIPGTVRARGPQCCSCKRDGQSSDLHPRYRRDITTSVRLVADRGVRAGRAG